MTEVIERPQVGQIYGLMAAVLADIGAVAKERQNVAQNYKFRGIDDVLNAVHDVFAKHGVFVIPEVIHVEREERKSAKDNALIYTILTVRHRFYAPDGSSVEGVTVGEGMDSGDKSANKAMSTALKYILFQAFAIPTEDGLKDSEDEDHEIEPRVRREDQEYDVQPGARHTPAHRAADGEITVEALKAEGEKHGFTDAQVMIRARKRHEGLRTLGDLTQNERADLISGMGSQSAARSIPAGQALPGLSDEEKREAVEAEKREAEKEV